MEKPAISLSAMPGRRTKVIEAAVEAERRGFAGVYCPTFGDAMALCQGIATATEKIRFGTSIANIYTRHASDYAQTSSFIRELSGDRFVFGVGISHDAVNQRLGVSTGKPLSDMRAFVETYRRSEKRVGPVAPIVLAALRKKMIALAGEIGDGVVWANAARSHMSESLAVLPAEKRRGGFFIGNMIPTCISEDRAAAAAVMRKVLLTYVQFPNYRKYWEEAGYGQEMREMSEAIDKGEKDRLVSLMPERWLRDVTLYGSAAEVREGLEAWRDAGVTTPILVASSVGGGQMKALEELWDAF